MKKKTKKVAVVVGAGAALAAAAVGAYYLTGKRGMKNRAKIGKWAMSAKKEAEAQFRKMKLQNAATYRKVVAAVAKRYETMNGVTSDEVAAIIRDLYKHWLVLSGSAKKTVKKAVGKGLKKIGAKKKKTPKIARR